MSLTRGLHSPNCTLRKRFISSSSFFRSMASYHTTHDDGTGKKGRTQAQGQGSTTTVRTKHERTSFYNYPCSSSKASEKSGEQSALLSTRGPGRGVSHDIKITRYGPPTSYTALAGLPHVHAYGKAATEISQLSDTHTYTYPHTGARTEPPTGSAQKPPCPLYAAKTDALVTGQAG